MRVAIVEDREQDAKLLNDHLNRYARENKCDIERVHFKNALVFLQEYKGGFDIVFMDIDMPVLSGMDAARCLREIDPHVLLIFVTALERFAVNGYEVNAFDFIVKPVQYNFFVNKINRARGAMTTERRTKVLIRSMERSVTLYTDEIIFVEIHNHVLSIHKKDDVITTRGTIKDIMDTLDETSFALCNKSCVVNLHFVEMVDGDDVVMEDGERLPISRPRKTAFMQQIADFYGSRKVNMGRY